VEIAMLHPWNFNKCRFQFASCFGHEFGHLASDVMKWCGAVGSFEPLVTMPFTFTYKIYRAFYGALNLSFCQAMRSKASFFPNAGSKAPGECGKLNAITNRSDPHGGRYSDTDKAEPENSKRRLDSTSCQW